MVGIHESPLKLGNTRAVVVGPWLWGPLLPTAARTVLQGICVNAIMRGMVTMAVKGDLLSVTEAADILGCSTSHVRFLLAEKIIEGEKLSERAWAVKRGSLNAYARKKITVGRPRKKIVETA